MSTIKSSAENLTLNADGSGNDVLIQSNGSTKAIVTAEGTLGIGTTAPLRQLHISNTSANPEIAFTSGTSGAASLLFGDGLTGTDVYKGYVQYQHNGDYMLIATGATDRLRVDSDGLKFNADTAAANALDDYERGTWTPTLTLTGSLGYATREGTYTKVGNLVNATFAIVINSVSSLSSVCGIGSLPFTVSGGSTADSSPIQFGIVRSLTTSYPSLTGYLAAGGTASTISVHLTNGGHIGLPGNAITASTILYGSMVYNT